jgi:hypothetical protein
MGTEIIRRMLWGCLVGGVILFTTSFVVSSPTSGALAAISGAMLVWAGMCVAALR